MAKKKERTEFTKQNYVSTFQLIGTAKLSDNTISLNNKSNKSDWVYNQMQLAVDCGDASGLCFSSMTGGYGSERDVNEIYVHGKNDNGTDDFTNRFTVKWEDREDPNILKEIGSRCFITIGLEKDTTGKTVYKNFLSAYDAIDYCNEVLKDGMVVNVTGNIQFQNYNGGFTSFCNITNIALSNATPDKYRATFSQTVLLDENCKGEINKATGEMEIQGYVLEYLKDYKGHSLKTDERSGQIVPIPYGFVYQINLEKPDLAKKAVEYLFKVKKDSVNMITFDGDIVSNGATIQMGVDDLPDDLKKLLALGIYTEEDAIAACATNGNRERKMVLRRPRVRNVQNDDGTSTPVVQIFEDQYSSVDLDYYREMEEKVEEQNIEDAMNPPEEPEETPFEEVADDGDLDWLRDLT